MTGNLVQVRKEFVKLHKDIYLTEDLFFVNNIPFFINLRRKICLKVVNHLANGKLETIPMAFKEIYSYYMKRGFPIIALHAYGEFPPQSYNLQAHDERIQDKSYM